MSRTVGNPPENRRIDSWKEIAAFFGRDERTVKRWEKERALPVHRLPGERGGVFAWSDELTAWLNSTTAVTNGRQNAEPPATPATALSATDPAPLTTAEQILTPASQARPHWIWHAVLVAAIISLSIYAFHSWRVSVRLRKETAAARHQPDHEAEEFYLKGRYYWSRRTEGSLNQAVDAFTQAVVHDSEYAKAYAGLAE